MTGAPLPPGVDTVVPVELTSQTGDTLTVQRGREAGRQRAPRRRGRRRRRRRPAARRTSRPGRDRPSRLGRRGPGAGDEAAARRDPRHGQRAGPGRRSRSAPGRSATRTRTPRTDRCSPPAPSRSCSASPATTSDETRRLIAAALEHDVVLTSGGVSVGEFDFVKQVQEELGVERRFWGVATKPGKPLAFGVRGRTLVFGVPGNPVAAMVSFELYIRPALLALQGRRDLYRPYVMAASAEPVKRTKERDRGAALPPGAARRRLGVHDHRAAGFGDPALDGARRRSRLRPGRSPRLRRRGGVHGAAPRRVERRAPAVPLSRRARTAPRGRVIRAQRSSSSNETSRPHTISRWLAL